MLFLSLFIFLSNHPLTIGIFRFIFTVNPDKIIEESDYNNNRRTAIYLIISDKYIGGWW